MRILRRISLQRGLDRIGATNKSDPWIHRINYKRIKPSDIPLGYEMHKYGVRPSYINLKTAVAILIGSSMALYWITYERELYKNELDTVYRYRESQHQNSNIWLRTRLLIFNTLLYLERSFFVSGFMKKQSMGKSTYYEYTEAILRYDQYANFMQNKNRKYDFLDIGILEKFPYSKEVQKIE